MHAKSTDLYGARPDLYDLMHRDYVDDMRFLQDFSRQLGDEPMVLELGCGTGRLLAPLLDAGALVTGLDRSKTMLQVARERLQSHGSRLTLVEGDMRRFSLGTRYDLAVIGLNTYMHMLTIDDQISTLESIHRHLRPAGLLLLDLTSPHAALRDTPLSVVQHRFTRTARSTTVTLWSVTEISTAAQLTHTTLFFDEAGDDDGALQRTIAEVELRLTYRYELEHLLTRAGFAIKHLYGDYESTPYDDDSERLICVSSALA